MPLGMPCSGPRPPCRRPATRASFVPRVVSLERQHLAPRAPAQAGPGLRVGGVKAPGQLGSWGQVMGFWCMGPGTREARDTHLLPTALVFTYCCVTNGFK